MKSQQLAIYGIIGICLYLISSGLSFAIFRSIHLPAKQVATVVTKTTTDGKQGHFIDTTQPKTEVCPLNGMLYTKQEKDIWEKRRPLAVMIENHEEARPQSGLSYADVIYEAIAEGGITRFMGIFYCGIAEPVAFAPVRSARVYFLPWVLEYDALYNHVGGAGNCNDDTVDERAKALCRIDEWKIKDMDQFGISIPTCIRNYDRLDHTVATEHTMVCYSDKLEKIASDRGWTNVDAKGIAWNKNFQPWKFKDDAAAADHGQATSIKYVAWKGYENSYGVTWDYDTTTNIYKRSTGGKPHLDLETKQQLAAKTVIVIFAKETSSVDVHMHMLYNNIGTGDGILFEDGKATKIRWSKNDKSARLKFLELNGKEMVLNKGQIWISMLGIGTPVEY